MIITAGRQLITPEMAQEMLKRNVNNRDMRERTVARYEREMENGGWGYFTDPVSFSVNGNLKNGQHRLMAIVRSGVAQYMTVETGVPEDAVYDAGLKRSDADRLFFEGKCEREYTGAPSVSLARYLCQILRRRPSNVEPTQNEMASILNEYGDLIVEVNKICARRIKPGAPTSNVMTKAGAFAAAYCGVPLYDLKEFFAIVQSGISTTPQGSNALVLRNYLVNSKPNRCTSTLAKYDTFTSMCEQAIYGYVMGTQRTKKFPDRRHPYFDEMRRKQREEQNRGEGNDDSQRTGPFRGCIKADGLQLD